MKKEPTCIFCQIIAGEEPSSVIYQDELIIALMTLNPTRPGEFMIIPKEHIDEFCDLSDELTSHIMIYAQHFSRNLRKVFKPKRVGLVVHGFGVAHAHLIIVPLQQSNDIVFGMRLSNEDGILHYGGKDSKPVDRQEIDRQAKSIFKGVA